MAATVPENTAVIQAIFQELYQTRKPRRKEMADLIKKAVLRDQVCGSRFVQGPRVLRLAVRMIRGHDASPYDIVLTAWASAGKGERGLGLYAWWLDDMQASHPSLCHNPNVVRRPYSLI